MGAVERLSRSHNLLYQAVPHMSLESVKKVQAVEMINDSFISKAWHFHLQAPIINNVLRYFEICFGIY
jgi:hypothetical protein